MTTMLDKAANAMAERLYQMEQDDDPPDCYRHLGMCDYEALARAALQAIREPSSEMVRAASESAADDGEGGNFGPLFDLLDFSGENKTRLVVAEALRKAVGAILEEKPE